MAKKQYSPAFKAKVVLEVLQEEQELSAIATKYNLNPNMLRNWKRRPACLRPCRLPSETANRAIISGQIKT